MKNHILFSISIIIIQFISCKALDKKIDFIKENENISLGMLASRENILKSTIEVKAIPDLNNQYTLSLIKRKASESLLKKELANKDAQYDSIALANSYYSLELIEDPKFVKDLNGDDLLQEYIYSNEDIGVLTKIYFFDTKSLFTKGNQSFLTYTPDLPEILLVSPQGEEKMIRFQDLKITDYELSYFCFAQNSQMDWVAIDLVEEGKRCKRPLKNKVKQKRKSFKKLINY